MIETLQHTEINETVPSTNVDTDCLAMAETAANQGNDKALKVIFKSIDRTAMGSGRLICKRSACEITFGNDVTYGADKCELLRERQLDIPKT